MPRGGSRPGAGRKPKDPQAVKKTAPKALVRAAVGDEKADPCPAPELTNDSPLEYLLSVMRNPGTEMRVRMQAASIAAPYCHAKKGEGESSKKAEQAAKAKQAGGGKFAASAPPKLIVNNGR